MISIIVPAYEKEKYIGSCLESICSQSYSDIEIIVVYRQGRDNTLIEINKIVDDRIKIVYQSENSGPGGARNIGIRESNGEFLGFVDCDDFISNDFYKNLHSAITKNSADIAVGEIWQIPQGGRGISTGAEERSLETFHDKYASITNGAVFNKLFRASFVKENEIAFPEKIFYEDNYWLLAAYFFSKKIVFVKNSIYNYRLTEKDAERNAALTHDVFPAVKTMVKFCKEHNFSVRDTQLVHKKILYSFAGEFLVSFANAKKMISLVGFHWFVPYKLMKKIVKNIILRILSR